MSAHSIAPECSDYSDLVAKLHENAEWYSDGHGPLHAAAANAIDHLMTLIRLMAPGVAQTVPSGWRLVPDRPTQRQMDAGLYQSSADSTWSDVYSIYADMIDAAPSIDDHPDDVNPVAAPPSNQGASK